MTDDRPPHGIARTLEDGLTCVLAPNPSPMTYWGTNTYLLGHDTLAVIDPGPRDAAHLDALIAAIAGRTVSHILVTHSHLDHSPLARPLADITGAPVLAFGDSHAGRSAVMHDLAQSGLMGGGEGVDVDFAPDVMLSDGATIKGDGWDLTARHTPGHFGNHLSFLWNNAAFCGDLVMGWATSLVSPPDGDLTEFMASCAKLAATGITRAYAGHGAPITDAQARIKALIYTDIAPALLPMAQRNVLAHLVDLTTRGRAAPIGTLSATTKFTLP